MRQLLDNAQMKALDQMTIQEKGIPSLVLMERAALAVCDILKDSYDLTHTLVVS